MLCIFVNKLQGINISEVINVYGKKHLYPGKLLKSLNPFKHE